MRTRVRMLLLVLACCSMSGTATAEDFDFETAIGDINGDGELDVFVRLKRRIIPIPIEDLLIPIAVPVPGTPRFVLVQQPSGGFATQFIQLEE